MIALVLKKGDKHKFVRQLKIYLNELVKPNPNLTIDDTFDEKTEKAILEFKRQWQGKFGSYSTLTGKGEADIFTWGFIGRALGSERLLRELSEIKDYELRSLLLGMNNFAVNVKYYTAEMENCDKKIASVLGGKNAVAAANGFEPEGIAIQGVHGFYRGDTVNVWKDGTERIGIGHLSRHIMHLYGSSDGTRLGVDGKTYTDIIIPDKFEIRKDTLNQTPTPTEAIVHFYYKRLGKVENATLLLMHVKDFKPIKLGSRWKIGQIGGKGGGIGIITQPYLHSHFVLLKGDVGLAIKTSKNGKMDGDATNEYRATIGIRFVDAFC